MKRVASLYLPDWPIERIVQAAQAWRTAAPPEAAAYASLDPLGRAAEAERATQCSVPRGGGWRPGARWASEDNGTARWARAVKSSTRKAGEGDREHSANGGGRPPPIVSPSPGPLHHFAGRGKMVPLPRFAREDLRRRLVTSRQDGNRLLIAAASPAARALGIVPGMAVTHARAQVPELDIRPADPDGDRAALLRLALLAARRWCPAVALSGDDGLFLDITGTAHLFGGEAAMARRIVRLLARAGFSARVAVADTAGAAWALARSPAPRHPREGGDPASSPASQKKRGPRLRGDDDRVVICPPGQHIAALAPLPVTALRLEPRAVELLRRLGIDSVGALATLPRAPLARRFGGTLIARLDQATGRLPEPLDPVIAREQVMATQRFAEPIATAEAIAHWLAVLLPRLVSALAEAGLGARTIELVADRIDGVPQRLRIGLARPTRDAAHLLRLMTRRIEEIAPGFGIDALALHVRRADPLGPEPFVQTLSDAAPDLAPLIDTLANRIGQRALWRARPLESDVPERSVAATDPLDPPGRDRTRVKADDVRQLDRSAPPHPWDARWPRPIRLLRRPEPIDDVLALLPDQPPRRFTWRGRTHRVIRADGPERIHGEWWQRASEAHSVRDYFRVEDEAGQRFWLFRRGDGERAETGDLSWFMHGSFG